MPTPILLFLDWDSTLTTTSTIPILLSLSPKSPSRSPADLSILYASSLAAHVSSYTPRANSRTTLVEEITYLNSLRDVERASIERCEEAGVWMGVTPQIIEDAAEKAVRERRVVLREGTGRVIEEVMKRGGRVVVLSVGWSGQFIRRCLRTTVGVEAEGVEIRANEIEEDGKLSRYFGAEEGGIWTCGDKARLLDEVGGRTKEVRTVYVGDSVTDLECLTCVDIGVCMTDKVEGREQKELCETLQRLRIKCTWILERKASEKGSGVAKDDVCLWWAKDFHEICEGLFLDGR